MSDDQVDRYAITSGRVIALIGAVAVVLLLAFARRDPGFDDRVPDPPAEIDEEVDDDD